MYDILACMNILDGLACVNILHGLATTVQRKLFYYGVYIDSNDCIGWMRVFRFLEIGYQSFVIQLNCYSSTIVLLLTVTNVLNFSVWTCLLALSLIISEDISSFHD